MVEIELRFEVKKLPLLKLPLKNEKRILDIYYDTPDYQLIVSGNFLRNRNNNKVDFKLDIGDTDHDFCKETRFDFSPFNNHDALKAVFDSINVNFSKNFNNFEEFLHVNKLIPLAVIDKNRKTYVIGDITISLDDCKDIGYFIEAEVNIEDGKAFDIAAIKKYIKEVLIRNKIIDFSAKPVSIGYVELYLKKHNLTAYNFGKYKN